MIMVKRRGFTLVELLVVIAIIALLMSILMPAVQLVRKQTKALLCVSNLRQWGVLFLMYADDNQGLFFGVGRGGYGYSWFDKLRPYYFEQGSITLCPMASQPALDWVDPADHTLGVHQVRPAGIFTAWGKLYGDVYWFEPGDYGRYWYEYGDYGSYGMNSWAGHETAPRSNIRPRLPADHWHGPYVRGAADVPLLMDSSRWRFSVWDTGQPPTYDGEPRSSYGYDEIRHCCLNRHNGYVGMLFLDGGVRRVGLKELWTLKWYRSFARNNMYTVAYYGGSRSACAAVWDSPEVAPWMKNMREY